MTVKLVLLLVAVAWWAPEAPRWPAHFTETFTEEMTYPVVGTYKTSGTFYHDATNARYRVDRDSGRGDRYCWLNGLHIFGSAACSHIVAEGKRYLYYPEKKSCCYCCSAKEGCGILKQDWLSGAEYKGQVDFNG